MIGKKNSLTNLACIIFKAGQNTTFCKALGTLQEGKDARVGREA